MRGGPKTQFREKRRGLFFLFVLFAIFLPLGCGSGESTEEIESNLRFVTGKVIKGPVRNGQLQIYEIRLNENGQVEEVQIGTTSTDNNGNYSVSIGGDRAQVELRLISGVYDDEITGENNIPIFPQSPLRVCIPNFPPRSSLNNIPITPYTTLACVLADYLIQEGLGVQSAFEQANEEIITKHVVVPNLINNSNLNFDLLNLDILNTLPSGFPPATVDFNDPRVIYMLLIAGLSQEAENIKTQVGSSFSFSAIDLLSALNDDLTDGTIDGNKGIDPIVFGSGVGQNQVSLSPMVLKEELTQAIENILQSLLGSQLPSLPTTTTTTTLSAVTTTTIPDINLSELVNPSGRAFVGTGNNVAIESFTIEDAPMVVFIRGLGPLMNSFGLAGLPNPTITLYSGSTAIATNDDWETTDPLCGSPIIACGGHQAILDAGFDLCEGNTAGCEQESALLVTLPPGPYGVIMKGVGGTTGIGLISVTEVDPGVSPESRLVHASTRAFVGTGNNAAIGNFTIEDAPMVVFIRGLGPLMNSFGLAGLPNPTITLYSGSTAIATNDDWETTDPLCGSPIIACGDYQAILDAGFDLCEGNTAGCEQESALLVMLPPGSYGVIMKGVGGTTGIGMISVQEKLPNT